jgi:hypothetical protein
MDQVNHPYRNHLHHIQNRGAYPISVITPSNQPILSSGFYTNDLSQANSNGAKPVQPAHLEMYDDGLPTYEEAYKQVMKEKSTNENVTTI